MPKFNRLLVAVSGLFLLLFSCGDNAQEAKGKQYAEAKPLKAATESVTFSAREYDGLRLFMRYCNKCHPGGEKGKGPSLNDKKLPNFLYHWQVRLGGGKMPKFTKEEISKEELDKIVEFLKKMRSLEGV